jgi:hypothetical protein
MQVCFFCGETIQDKARVCPYCGRDLTYRASRTRRDAPKQKQKTALLGMAIGSVLALIFIVILGFKYCSKSPSRPTVTMTTPEPSPTLAASSARKNKRLFLDNNLLDAGERELAFKRIVHSAGERCDGIEKSAMRSPGSWIITCAPGYIYTFSFDKRGELTEMRKMN